MHVAELRRRRLLQRRLRRCRDRRRHLLQRSASGARRHLYRGAVQVQRRRAVRQQRRLPQRCPASPRIATRTGDGYGAGKVTRCERAPAAGYVLMGGDCCDSDPGTYPGVSSYPSAANACGGFDRNCNGKVERRGRQHDDLRLRRARHRKDRRRPDLHGLPVRLRDSRPLVATPRGIPTASGRNDWRRTACHRGVTASGHGVTRRFALFGRARASRTTDLRWPACC